jgi:GTPase SAR1 family protein
MSENYFKDSRYLLKKVDEFSEFKLQRRDDLQILFTEGVKEENKKLFEDLVFTAKYVQGLMKVMKMGQENSEVKSLEHVKTDLTKNMEKVVEQIREIISNSSKSDKDYIEKNFLEMSPDAFKNLNELLADLDWTKKYLNDLKRS